MTKSEWYNHLIERIDISIDNEYFNEASFICYGIIEDRLASLMIKCNLPIGRKGVAAKIKALTKHRSEKSEHTLLFSNWDGEKYKDAGILKDVLAWGTLYRNPLQHQLGDPRDYKAQIGDFHTTHTKNMAEEGKIVVRNLSAAVMRWKKWKKN